MQVVRSIAGLREWRAELSKSAAVVLVPTMGALHEGHRSLIRVARQRGDQVVVSIFVNPLQFGAGEDLDRYPRTLDADLDACQTEGADVVFIPEATDLYRPDRQVGLQIGPMAEVFEGASRPGHFDGVLTVVAKLFHLVDPQVAIFGQKDAQQLACIRRMVADLDFGIEIVGAPTVRDVDGLALSSRNRYLSSDERSLALALSQALRAGAGETTPATIVSAAQKVLDQAAEDPAFEVDYLALVDEAGFTAIGEEVAPLPRPSYLLVAARVGTTRLIDNYRFD